MRRKLTVILVLAAAVSTFGIARSNNAGVPTRGGDGAGAPAAPAKTVSQEPPGTVDGANHPELIPDGVAYSLLFRFLSGRRTEEERNRARSYLKMVFGCHTCENQPLTAEQRAVARANVDALLTAAEEFEQRVGQLDTQAKSIRERFGRDLNPSARAQLRELQRLKEAVVTELVASLPGRLRANGTERLRRFVNEHFKRRVKLTPPHEPNQSARPTNAA